MALILQQTGGPANPACLVKYGFRIQIEAWGKPDKIMIACSSL